MARPRAWVITAAASLLAGGVLATSLAGQVTSPPADAGRPPASASTTAPPPPMGFAHPSRLSAFLAQPGRVSVRDTVDLGVIDASAPDKQSASLKLQVILAYDAAQTNDRARGVAMTVAVASGSYTSYLDDDQLPELRRALDKLATTAGRLRVPQVDTRRRAVYVINDLEIAMLAGGAAGQVAPLGAAEEFAARIGPSEFAQLRDLLARAAALIARDVQRPQGEREP